MATARFTGWIHSALPAAVIDAPDEVRGPRDRAVDAAMYLISFCVASATLATTWELHPPWLRVVAIVVGLGTIVSLRWRRTHPAEVGIGVGVISTVIITASGANLVALFNAAIRARGRDLWIVAGLGVVWGFTNPWLYPDKDYWQDVGASLLLTAVAVGSACSCARAGRWCARCASRPTAPGTRRARLSGGGSRARCTTCSPTACR